MRKKILIELIVCLFLALPAGCAKNDNPVEAFSQDLVIEIIAGPLEGGSILNNSRFAFEWRARGGGNNTSYQVQLSGVDGSPVSTSETSKSYPGQPSGSYTFTVTVTSGGESVAASRTFTVGANLGPPEVMISGARGSASSGGSGVTPAYAPGQSAHFLWAGQDADRFGSIAGYRWRNSDTGSFSEFTLGTTAGFDVPASPGNYTFTLEAMDNDGEVSTTTIQYEVKLPTILIVDDKAQSSSVDEVDEDGFYAKLIEGFAFATWDVASQGQPATNDLTPYDVVFVYSGSGSALWQSVGTDYPESSVPLSEFLDAGGKLWAMGQGILEDINQGHGNPPASNEFEAAYLHLAAATGDTIVDPTLQWSIAGESAGDLKFSFADDVLSDPLNFPRITMDVQSGDVDQVVPDINAEIIYQGKGGLGDVVGDVALRFPSGGGNTQIVFCTFPLFETATVKSSLLNARALAQQIMREMGQ